MPSRATCSSATTPTSCAPAPSCRRRQGKAEGLQHPHRRPADPVQPERAEGSQRLGAGVDTRAELAGMSDKAIDAAAAEAKKRGMDGKFVIPVVNTTQQAPLSVLTNRETREKLLAVSLARGSHGGEFDNREVVLDLAKAARRTRRAAGLSEPRRLHAGRPDREDHRRRELAAGRIRQAGREQREKGSGRDPEGDRCRRRQIPGRRLRLESFYSDKVRQAALRLR
jgi:peptidyl-dipeptidase Dcp